MKDAKVKKNKKNNVLLILLISLAVTGVFFALNDYYAWLTFFRLGQGQNFNAGYIDSKLTASYAQGVDPEEYLYVPGDDLCKPAVLGLNVSFTYTSQEPCQLRFLIEFQNTYKDVQTGQEETNPMSSAFDKTFDYGFYVLPDPSNSSAPYDPDALDKKGKALIHAAFTSDFKAAYENDTEQGRWRTYWYYNPSVGGAVLAAAPGGAPINNIITSLELVGDNIVIEDKKNNISATGEITIKIIAQIRQSEGPTWSNYTSSIWSSYKEASVSLKV